MRGFNTIKQENNNMNLPNGKGIKRAMQQFEKSTNIKLMAWFVSICFGLSLLLPALAEFIKAIK